MQFNPTRIVIVGGGSAGWLTAGILAAYHQCHKNKSVKIQLVESDDLPTIGVGEGTWPSMRATLKSMGVSETEFIIECDVSFKQGSKFINWHQTDNHQYDHPFTMPIDFQTINLAPHWQPHKQKVSFADAVCSQGLISEKKLAPKQITTPEFSFNLNYGYHLDAAKFAQFLKRHCVDKLGVEHVIGTVKEVNRDSEDYVYELILGNGEPIKGDVFVDCTGFSSLLLGQHYKIPFKSKSDILLNDTALAMHIPYASADAPIASSTLSTGQKHGWIWDIGLPTRRGAGYVYSSAHTNEEEALNALMDYARLNSTCDIEKLSPRKIKINPGHREKFWHKNVVAIGLSAGFIEPLEASALVLVELSANMLAEQLPTNRKAMEIIAKRFNHTFLYRWQRIIEFLKLHYVLSERTDSDYWQDMRSNQTIPERLQELLELWRYQSPYNYDFQHANEMFPAASYQYILYGMGFSGPNEERTSWRAHQSVAAQCFQKKQQETNRLLNVLPSNRALLNKISQYGLPKI